MLLFDFALCDVIGRLLVPHRCGITKDNIWIPVLARICILFPLILCSVRGVIFTHDFWSVLFVGLLGLTNGYVGSLSVVLVNEVVDVHERGIAGMYSGFVLNAGLMVGATLALYADKLVTST